MLACLLVLYYYPLTRYFVALAKLSPRHLQLSHPPKPESPSITPLFWKSPFHFKGITQHDAPTALALSPPLADPQRCRDGLCASYFSADFTQQPGDSANGAAGELDAGQVCLCLCVEERGERVYVARKRCSCLNEWLSATDHRLRRTGSVSFVETKRVIIMWACVWVWPFRFSYILT